MAYGIFQSHGKSFRDFIGGGGQHAPDYPIYSIYLQSIIINDAKQEKVVEYEKLVLEGIFDKVLAEPTTENISNYKEKIEFRDYLIKNNSNKSVKLNIELLVTIIVAILPIAWQVITYFLSFK
jgi:ethanolamine ammonia-lyase large subunit